MDLSSEEAPHHPGGYRSWQEASKAVARAAALAADEQLRLLQATESRIQAHQRLLESRRRLEEAERCYDATRLAEETARQRWKTAAELTLTLAVSAAHIARARTVE